MEIDSRLMRNALGRFATGVCVITASPEGSAPLGMTVNSFSALSLDPPLVLWNIQKNSECLDAYLGVKGWTVNVLSFEQQEMSTRYAKKGDHLLADGCYIQGKSGFPVLRDVLVSMECEHWEHYEGGDHIILVGKVVHMEDSFAGEPLVFYSGQYRELR